MLRQPVGESARAFVLMRVEGWNREKKGVKRPSVSTEGRGGSAKRPWKRVCSYLAMFPTA